MIFIGIVSMITAGVLTLATAHYSRASTEANYAAALDAAEAGANFELRKISDDVTQADGAGSTGGAAYALSDGGFKVYCTSRTGGPFIPGQTLYIYSTGTVNGLSRTVQLAAKPGSAQGKDNYVLYGVTSGFRSGNSRAVGNIGSNGDLSWSGPATVSGKVIFNGPGAGWSKQPSGTLSTVYNPNALAWPTVETLASEEFPLGGLTWLASNNDNALSGIKNNSLTASGSFTFQSKVGGANYYLTGLTTGLNTALYFNNLLGPITVWIGPSGANTNITISGASSMLDATQDSTKLVRLYIATSGNVTWDGSASIDAGIYNVNNSGTGSIIFNGGAQVLGQVIANSYSLEGAGSLTYQGGYFPVPGADYYGMDNALFEDNGAWN
ncbi:MAG: hypothetical protein KGJ62_08520 [Armatimonadetes bacterium]|nr:hypothetical protein [Armatimonadota bacterium]MDE2205064.1 hypothetical protein [Armatimonadota bacterium]